PAPVYVSRRAASAKRKQRQPSTSLAELLLTCIGGLGMVPPLICPKLERNRTLRCDGRRVRAVAGGNPRRCRVGHQAGQNGESGIGQPTGGSDGERRPWWLGQRQGRG